MVDVVNPPFLLTDPAGANAGRRFYRAASDTTTAVNRLERFAWIDPGTFRMGSPSTERDRNGDEGPQTEVTISRGFAMSKFETTQGEYLAVMGTNPANFAGDLERPVEMVSWDDATNYCARLTSRELLAGRLPAGYSYRLPTEAEWEYACRAGTTNATAFGNSLSSTQANFNGTGPYNGAAAGPNLLRPTKVGSYPPNAWGLYDMHGNVWEFSSSRYGTYPGGSVIDPADWSSGAIRAYRGGSWYLYGWNSRSSSRGGLSQISKIHSLGFRLALDPGVPDSATLPTIVRHPQSQPAKGGEALTLSVTATGSPLFYQWRFNGAAIPGATTANLRIARVQMGDAGGYSVVVKNSAGRVTSQTAIVTVDPPLNPDPVRLVWLNPGTFTMGSPASQPERGTDEGPQTDVTFTEGFWMSKSETTQEEYLAVMGNNPSSFTGNVKRPVEAVRWVDAVNYCTKLTLSERAAGRLPVGFEYRLPTEAEWEYACRAGTITASAFGGSLSSTQANFNGNFPYGGAFGGPYLQTTAVVNSYPSNPWGFFDMHGNVWEWCSDWYGAYAGGSVTAPQGPTVGTTRALRGGGWNSSGRSALSSARSSALPGDPGNGFGFRTVLAPGPWNGGFEQATLTGWKASGNLNDWRPITGDLLSVKRISPLQQQIANSIGGDYWRDLTHPVGHKGKQWICTALSPQEGPESWADNTFNEGSTGTLISQSFVTKKKVITFLIGGGADDQNLRVELLMQTTTAGANTVQVDGQTYAVVNYATGHGQETMRRAHWDVSGPALANRQARIRIVDQSTTGHLNVDDFRFQETKPADDSITLGGATYPATMPFEGYEVDADSPVWGFADLHTHPMSYLGFGGKIMHGQPDGGPASPSDMTLALMDCSANHGGWGLDNPQGNYWRQIMMFALDDAGPDPHREGWSNDPSVQFRNWPVFTTVAHQQMWYEWIKRARDGGLRVMVALCVNNKLLATISKGDKPVDDQTVGDSQIAELKNFAARHNDFMEIAYDPIQLRAIVRSGKLAVIIGSELDDIGNFARNPAVNAIADESSKQIVRAEIQRLHAAGVRYMFPVHLVNNKFGGTAIAGLMLNVANKYVNGEGFQVAPAPATDNIHFWLENIDFRTFIGLTNIPPDFANVILAAGAAAGAPLIPVVLPMVATAAATIAPVLPGESAAFAGIAPLAIIGAANLLPPLLTVIAVDQGEVIASIIPLPGNYPIYPTKTEAPNGTRNALGLTPLGRFAINEMMNLGIMIDADHMSQQAISGPRGLIEMATGRPVGYPINSGHNGFRDLGIEERAENSRTATQMEKIQELGGLIGVGWENSKDGSFTKAFGEVSSPVFSHSEIDNDCAGTSKTFAQTFLLALERLKGGHIAIGTDINGFVVSPGPRFGPQAAFGLGAKEEAERHEQIDAQHNGVLYEPRYAPPLTTSAFRGRAMEPKNLTGEVVTTNGYAYNVDQADFFAALNIFYSLEAGVAAGSVTEQSVMAPINTTAVSYSANYAGQYPETDLSGGSRAHIANYALGLLAGIKNWTIGFDATPDKTATTMIGKAVYQNKNVPGSVLPVEIAASPEYLKRYLHQLKVWDDYQKIFGTNTPMKRSRSGSKQWDINFEGVAHYGLLPDFLQDLSNVGMEARDLSVLFRSAEDFAQMWSKCLNSSWPAQTID